jgi:tricorn protease
MIASILKVDTPMKTTLYLLGLALSAGWGGIAYAQLAPPEHQAVVGARMPALSPDGKRLAFVYKGDIWVASSEGGRATALTQHVEIDAYPLFSPDGKWVAFSSKRRGSWDIYVIPAEGGTARQLTWHGGSEIAQGWSPDGKYLLFSAKRDTPNFCLFALDVQTLRSEKLTEDYTTINYPGYSPDGKSIVYGRYGFPWTRPRYVGSAAAQIWVLNPADGTRKQVTQDDRQHLWTRFLPDGKRLLTVTVGETTPSASGLNEVATKFVDSAARTPNLWSFDLEGKGTQLTTFVGGSVRFPCVASKSGDVAFEYGADLWLMKGRKKPVKLTFSVAADEKQTTRRREKLTKDLTEMEISPDGKTFALGLRGDIWTVPLEKPKGVAGRNAEFARRLTEWEGEDSDFFWSKDGKKLYFTSDREFNVRVYELDVETAKIKSLWNRSEDVVRPQVSPDGKQLGFWVSGRNGGLYVIALETGVARQLVKSPGTQSGGNGGGDFAWSPDMQWVAYMNRTESRAWNIFIVPAAGGEPVNVTRLYAHHGNPQWSPDGKYLYFQSNRDGDGLYVLPLTKEPARSTDTDIKFEKPKDPVKVEIDFADIQLRSRKLANQYPQNSLTVNEDGLILFISEGDIWSVTYDGKETKRLTTGGGKGGLRLVKGGKVAYLQGGELYTLKISDKAIEKISFTAEWERDTQAERKAAFTHFWRAYYRGFYDPNFHGRNWEAIRVRYEPMLAAVETNDEFSNLLSMMIGELEASHSEVTAAQGSIPEPVTPQLGFMFDYSYAGPGVRVAKVPIGAPGWYFRTQIKEGEYVLAINGQDVALGEKLYAQINDKQDHEFEFLVNTNAVKEGARKVKYKVLSTSEWDDLLYKNRVERLRKYTDEKSTNKIGYLHISAMGGQNQLQFEREIYEYIQGKDAMVIDVRFNRGGNISDTLIDWLERKQHGYFRPRDGAPEPSPSRAWEKPIVVLMNEHSYSNGEMFPNAMRQRGLARLVGMPTPGYVIWTSGFRLVEGTGARMPQSGVYRLDGSNMEDLGEKPDVQLWLTPEDWLNDRDPQLDKAIEMLKKAQ